MSEVVAEVKILMVHMKCDNCGKGFMLADNEIRYSNPPQIKHKCNKCGIIRYYNRTYPHQRMVPLEDFREPFKNEVC